jgi:pimeloyl-ACP methyl ester carboxylesterase
MTYVYLHGFASGPHSTKARYFREHFVREGRELLVPDLAEGDFERLTISGQLAVIERAVAGDHAVLIGSSMGGYLAALFGARHPNVERVLLLAPAFGFTSLWAETMDPHLLEGWRRTGWLEVYHYGDRRNRRLSIALLEDAAGYEDYPAVVQPALIFHGTADTVALPARSQEFAARHPHAALRLVNSGHELIDALDLIWEGSRGFLFGAAG